MTGTPFAATARSLEPTRRTYLVRRLLVGVVTCLVAGSIAVALSPPDRSSIVDTALQPAPDDDGGQREPVESSGIQSAPARLTPPLSQLEAATEQNDAMPLRTSRFVAAGPDRLLDTRASGAATPRPDHAETVAVPNDVSAVALSISVVETQQPGSVFVDGRAGTVEAMTTGPADTTTNLVIVPVIGDELTLTTTAGGHLVVDLVGTFQSSARSTSGRFVAIAPDRIARVETAADGPDVELAFGRSIRAGASAVLVSISGDVGANGGTVRIGQGPGSFDQMLMWTPAIHDDGKRQSLAVIRPTENFVAALSYEGGQTLSVDVLGYFTDENAVASTDGLYVPSGPRQLFVGELDGESPLEATGIEPTANSALVIVGSLNDVGSRFGSALLPVREGTMSITAATRLEARVTLLGVFL